jgi:GAF domain-containing protein
MSKHKIFDHILKNGLKVLNLEIGIISRINSDVYTVIHCVGGGSKIKNGDEFELADTYCADVIKEKQTKYYYDVAKISEMLKHPVYLNTQLRAYIGTPIIVQNVIIGTLNYSSGDPREVVYTNDEVRFIERQAQQVAALLRDTRNLQGIAANY